MSAIGRAGGIILILSLSQDCQEPGLKLIYADQFLHLPGSLKSGTMKLGDCIVSYIEDTELYVYIKFGFST